MNRALASVVLLAGCEYLQTRPGHERSPTPDAAVEVDARATVDALPEPDAPPPQCGDGVRAPGEVCARLLTLPASDGAYVARLADVDGDGTLDLITLGAHRVAIRIGDGAGGFGEEQPGPSARRTMMAVGDLDADGRVDIVTATANVVSIWRNLGGVTFAPAKDVRFGGDVSAIDMANLDRYPGDELAVTTGLDVELLSGGAGGDRVVAYRACHGLALRDFDGDGLPDIATLCRRDDYQDDPAVTMTVFASASAELDVVPASNSARLLDVALARKHGGTSSRVLAAQSGPTGIESLYPGGYLELSATGEEPLLVAVAAADLDGDGTDDPILATASPAAVVVQGGARTTTFALPAPVSSLRADADVNGDGFADPVLALGDRTALLLSAAP